MNRLHSSLRRFHRTTLCSLGVLAFSLLLGGADPAHAAISEGFESVFGTGYGAHTSTGWYISNGLRGTTARSGSFAARFTSVANAYLQYESTDGNGKDGGVGNISFWYREWATADASTFSVQYNVNGAGWNTIATVTPTLASYVQYSYDLNNTADNIIVRIYKTGTGRVLIDDFSIADYSFSGIWINPMSAGTPMGTYYLGDTMGSWNVNFEIGQTTWNYAQVGIGTATDGTGYNWGVANWYEDGSGSNKRVRRDLNGYQYTAVGSHYVICQAKANSGDPYTSKSGNGWGNPSAYPPADLSSAYFTCSALNNPGSLSASPASTSQINLTWARGTSGTAKDTVIFRSTSATPPTITQGTSYSQGTTYSGYYCLYKGNGTSTSDTGLSASTTYYYYFYAENYSYYSPGTSTSATTLSPPTITLSAAALSAFSTVVGTPSASQTFTVAGVNLTANITVAAPAGFEVSTSSGSGYGSSVSLTPSGGTVSTTTIYIRLTGAAVGSPSGNVTANSTGATQQTKAASGTVNNNAISDIINDTGFTEPSNIAYASYQGADITTGNSIPVGQFIIRDGGGSADADSAATTLNAITFTVANSANLRRLAIYDGSTEIAEMAGGASVAFSSLSGLVAADGGTKTFTLRASFLSAVTDNQQLSFTVSSATASSAGSTFAAGNAGGAATSMTGDRNRIEVTATKLVFSVAPPATVGVSMSFGVTVQAQDANNNLDLDAAHSVTIGKVSGTGALSGGTAQTLSSGQRVFTGLQVDAADTYVIEATASGLTAATSGNVVATVQYAGSGTFTKISSTDDLIDGYYVIAYGTTFAMNNVNASGNNYFERTAISPSSDTITDPPVSIVWKIETDAYGKTIFNEASNVYVSYQGSANAVYPVPAAGTGTSNRWAFTWASTVFQVNNVGTTSRYLQYNSSSPRFACYAGTQQHLTLYRIVTATVPDAPTITGITPGNAQLSVAFTAPASDGGSAILDYKYSTDGGSSWKSVGTTASPFTITEVSGSAAALVNGTSYNVQIRAVNAVGDGTATGSTAATPRTIPSAPTITGITPGNAQLSIAFTAGGNGGSAITDYKYSTDGGSSWKSAGTTASPFTITEVSGSSASLVNGTSYNVQIRAVNVAGDGTPTGSTAATPRTIPSAPTITGITPGNAQLSIAFTAGGNGGATITDYKYSTDGGSSWKSAGTTASPFTITTISSSSASLVNGTSYSVQIRAVNAAGDGTPTGSTAATPRTTPTVTTPTATGIGQTAATLGANVTATGGDAVSARGTVYGTTANPTGNGSASGSGLGVFTHERTGLTQGTKYFYRGYAVNGAGTAYSSDGSFYTEPAQATDVAFANVTATGMRITWTKPASADGVIIVVRAGDANVADPTDGTLHSASATFGSGADLGSGSRVVYRDGAATQVDVSNLSPGTTYYVEAFAYKGTVGNSGDDQGINYRQTTPATGNRPTLASEPTSNASGISFSGVQTYQMNVNWTSGDGANRIVVVKESSAVNWSPTDGVAPGSVNADFSMAGDQGATGSKICYSGSGSSFTLTGLNAETTYHVKIFEYNGSGTEVNYYTGGTPPTGSQATTAAACVPGEVVLVQRTANYPWILADGGNTFNQGTDEVGMWANTGNKRTAAWRLFRTDGSGGGSARELQPGDRFRISVYGYSPYGILGASLNDGASTSTWADRTNASRGMIECGNGTYSDLYVKDAGGSASWSGIRPWGTTITMQFDILSSREFTANIVGQTPKYDRTMYGSPGNDDRIDGYSIYYADDWNGSGSQNAYWKPETSVTNLGFVEFGADGGTRTIAGKITDGTNPKCPDTPSPNYLKKSGSGTITLGNAANTYSLYTEIANGTLNVAGDGALGTAPAGTSPLHLRLNGAGARLAATETFTLNANRGITLSNWAFLAVADNKILTYNGVITDGAGTQNLVKDQGGELVLGGANTFDGGFYVDNGTLTLNHANAGGTDGLYVGMESGSLPATLNLGLATTYANAVTIRSGSTGIKYLKAADTATLSGAFAITESTDDRFNVDVASGKILTLSGVMSGTGGGKITKTGAGTLTLSNVGNTHTKKVQINAGTVSISNSRNLGEDPGGIYTNKVILNGGTLKATATFAAHANVGLALGANSGFIDVDPTFTLTWPAPVIGSGGFGKIGNGTLKLTGASTFTGPATNSAGILQIGDNGAVGSVSANIVNNAALIWHRSDSPSYSGVISGTGTLEKKGAGALTLSGNNGYSGNTTVTEGTLTIAHANALGTTAGNTTVAGGAQLRLSGVGTAEPLVLNGDGPSSGGALNNAGGGNTVSGAITLGSAARINSDSSILTLTGGISGGYALTFGGAQNVTVNSVIGNVTSIAKDGAGTLTLSSGYTHTFSGTATVSAGTLINNALASSMAVSVASGATLVGTGTNAAVSVTGTVDPGATAGAVGKLTASTLTLNAGGALRVDISNVAGTAGVNWDLAAATGNVTIGGAATIKLAGNPTGWDATAGYSWLVMDGGGTTTGEGSLTVDTTSFSPGLDGGAFSIVKSGNDLFVVFTPRIPDPPPTFWASATNLTSIALSFTKNGQNDDVVIVYNTTGLGNFTVPTGTAPGAGNSFAGGTVVFKGGTSPTTHASLDACRTYYYRAWSMKGTNYSSAKDVTETTLTPAAPATVWASATNETDFTAAWDAVTGASGYRLDVSTYNNFEAPGTPVNLMSTETMGTTGTDGSTIATHESNNRFVNTALTMSGTGDMKTTSSSSGYPGASGSFNVMLNASGEYFTIADIDSSGKSGMKLYFGINKNVNAENGSTIAIEASTNGSTWVSCGSVSLPTGENGWYYRTNDVPDSMAGSNLRIRFTSSSTVIWRLDDISLTAAGASGPSYVTGYSNLTVAGTSQTVSGLSTGVKYYFRVRTHGAGGCDGANSSTADVTTVIVPAIALADNGTQVTAANVTAGTANLVLYKLQLGVTALATELSGVSFTTAGSYAAADVSKFQVWYSADNSFATTGDNVQLGSDITTGLGTGSHNVAGLTKALAVGTHYIFITANLAAVPTAYGNQINVAALTTANVTFTVGNKSGTPTAGGLQTIIGAEPAAHCTDLVFSSVGTTSMNLGWTLPSPAPEGVIVVVRQGSAVSLTPSDLTSYLGINADFTAATDQGSGNKVCYSGSGSSFALSGLTPDTLYYVKIFEFNGTGNFVNYYTGGTPLAGSQTTVCIDVTGSLWASATNLTDFTAQWSSVSGATGYQLDVSTNATFTGGPTVLVDEGFTSGTTPPSGWTFTSIGGTYTAGGSYGAASPSLQMDATGDRVQTAGFANPTNVTFWVKGQGTDSSSALLVESAAGGSWSTVANISSLPTTGTTLSYALGSSVTNLRFTYTKSVGNLAFDDVRVTGPTTAYVSGYQSLPVSGTSQAVTGLTEGQTYYFRVRATNSACVGGNSSTASVVLPARPGIGVNEELSQSGVLGSNPGNQTFAVTNVGGGTLSYSIITNAAWLSVSPVVGSGLANGQSTSHTVSYNLAGLNPGVSNATITLTGTGTGNNAASNSPRTISVTLTIGLPDNPAFASATVDGNTLMRLAWTKNASYDVMIVYKAGSASSAPTQNQAYGVGDSCGGGTVIYKGSASTLDHVVKTGETHYYAFYSYVGNNYSTGLSASDSTGSFAAGEIVDTFSYTNGTVLGSYGNGSNGWSGAWSGDTSAFSNRNGSFGIQAEYPVPTGNKLEINPAGGTAKAITRQFDWISSKIYASYYLNFDYGGHSAGQEKWAGAVLMDNSTERVYFGESGGGDQKLGLLTLVDDRSLLAGYNQDYIIIVKYDIANDNAYVKAYKVGTDTVPASEETNWDAEWLNVNPGGGGYWINGIKLTVGGNGSATPGQTFFDEVRVGTDWASVVVTDTSAPLVPSTPPMNGEFFRVMAGSQFIAPASESGTSNVHYRIPDNVFGELGDSGRSGNLQNPGFDASANGWSRTVGNNIAVWNATSGDLAGGSAGGLLFNAWDNSTDAFGEYLQDVAATSGAQIAFSALMRQDQAFESGFFGLKMQFVNSSGNLLDIVGANDGAQMMKSTTGVNVTTQRISVAATAPAGTDRVRLLVMMRDPPGLGSGGSITPLLNPGFDGASGATINGWTRQSDAGNIAWGDGNAGANAGGSGAGIKFDAYTANGSGGFRQDAACQPGDVVTFRARMLQNGTWSTAFFGTRMQFLDSGGSVIGGTTYSSTDEVTTQSKHISVTATAPAGAVTVRCFIRMEGAPGGSDLFGYADDASLSGATTAGGGVSRFGYVDNCQLTGAGEQGTGAATLGLFFSAYDPETGLTRGTTDNSKQSNVDIYNSSKTWKNDDVAGFSASFSSAETKSSVSTSAWYWTLGNADFSKLLTDNYDNTNNGASYAADGRVFATNIVRVSLANGRSTPLWVTNRQYGYLSIQDDDVQPPTPTLLYVGTNVLNDSYSDANRKITVTDEEMLGGGVDVAYTWYDPSGVFLTNANGAANQFEEVSGNMANVGPNFDLTNATYGSLGHDVLHTPGTLIGSNGATVVTCRWVNLTIPGLNKAKIPLHEEWTFTVSAQDMDADRGSFTNVAEASKTDSFVSQDRATAINVPLSFYIQDDDTNAPVVSASSLTEKTDGQMRTGNWTLNVNARDDGSGLAKGDGTATSSSDQSPYVSLYAPTAYPVLLQEVFDNYGTITNGTSGKGRDFPLTVQVPSVPYEDIVLGAHTVAVTVADFDDDRYDVWPGGVSIDRSISLNSNATTFAVVDDDGDEPEIIKLTVDGVGGDGSSNLFAGAIAIIGVNGDVTNAEPHTNECFAFVVLAPFPLGTRIHFTDCGWSNNSTFAWLNTNEFHRTYWDSTGKEAVGDVIKLSLTNQNNAGDQVLVYQYTGTGEPISDPANVKPIYAVNLRSEWTDNPPSEPERSALYKGLTNGVTAVSLPLAGSLNARYTGSRSGTASELLQQISDKNNWTVDPANTNYADFGADFNVTGAGTFDWEVPEISDHQMRWGGYWVTNVVQDTGSGLVATNFTRGDGQTATAPYYVLFNTNSEVAVSNDFPTAYPNGYNVGLVTNVVQAGTGIYETITLGMVDFFVSVMDADDDRPDDTLFSTNVLQVSVYDDDPTPPEVAFTNILGNGSKDYVTNNGEIVFCDFGPGVDELNLQPTRAHVSVLSVADVNKNGTEPGAIAGVSGASATSTGWVDPTNYWEFAITMQPGFSLNLLSFQFSQQRSSTGPTNWALRCSGDGFVGDLAAGTLTGQDTFQTISAALATSSNTGEVVYRLYGWNASGNAGRWRIDNLYMTGKVATVAGAYVVTDSDLNTNGVVFQARVQDTTSGVFGITHDAHKPTWEVRSSAGTLSANRTFGAGPADGGAKLSAASMVTTAGFAKADIVLGIYTAAVRAVDYDDDRIDDVLIAAATNTFNVIDDDASPPRFTLSGTYRKFDGKTGVNSTNPAVAVTDGDLTNGLSISSRVYDVKSGLLAASNQFRVQSPDGWDSGLVNFAIKPSSDGGAKTSAYDAASTTVAINDYDVQLNAGGGRALGTWTTTFYAVDFDDDRSNDSLATNQVVQMYVIDDDVKGPRMTNLVASGAGGTYLYTGFEAADGWNPQTTTTNWTQTVAGVQWVVSNAYVQTANGRTPDNNGNAGYHFGFNSVTSALALPPMNQPGWLVVWARNSGNTQTAQWIAERLDGGTWVNLGTNYVAGTDYVENVWLVDSTNVNVSLRLRMVATGGSIFFDDLFVLPYQPWSTNAVTLGWNVATDDTGVDAYRVMPLRTQAPFYATNGTSLGLATSTAFAPTKETQGTVTGYVFAVDADKDRGPRDQSMGVAMPTIARLDIVPPTAVPLATYDPVSNEDVDDPTSQFDVTWNAGDVGGDDVGRDDVYPSWGLARRQFLSPWKTYKVYYGPYDSLQVPAGDPGRNNGGAYIYTNFIANGNYKTNPEWKFVVATSRVDDVTAPSAAVYTNLANASTNKMRLYDLEFDTEYVVVIVGVDEAGNEGPATPASWATNDTIRFALIRGVTMDKATAQTKHPNAALTNAQAENASALYWIAAGTTSNQVDYSNVKKDYDLLYWDAANFKESTNNQWNSIGTVRTNWFVDDGGLARDRGNLRFYRASYKDRWQTTRTVINQGATNVVPQRPMASEEVYSLHNVILSAGPNFVALQGEPYTNTFRGVFGGTENFPGGPSGLPGSGATVVEFYAAGTNAVSATQFWLSSSGNWFQMGGGNVTTNLQGSNFFTRGFSITLPEDTNTWSSYATTTAWDSAAKTNPVPALVWSPIMQVPTNNVPGGTFNQVISCGQRGNRTNGNKDVLVYNLAALRLPLALHPSQMRLVECGFTGGRHGQSDEIYTMNTATKSTLSGSTVYYDTTVSVPNGEDWRRWRFTAATNTYVPWGYFKPNDVIVIVSRNWVVQTNQTPGTWKWTYSPGHYYENPNRWMGY